MGANSYNICPRCGNSNALSAKYCSRCGGQLKVPEEPVICHKCHARNSPMANFCRNCGAELKVGWETKICPKCGKEVDAHDSVCTCGYSFVTFQQTAPAVQPPAGTRAKISGTSKKMYKVKGGRGWAIVSFVFLLLLAYYIFMPLQIGNLLYRPEALSKFDKGFVTVSSEPVLYWYGGECISAFIKNAAEGTLSSFGAANIMIAALVAIAVITLAVQLILCIVRIFNDKRNKYIGWYYLVMCGIYCLLISLITIFSRPGIAESLSALSKAFSLPEGYTVGYALWSLPVYYLFFFLISLCSRAKLLKEHK